MDIITTKTLLGEGLNAITRVCDAHLIGRDRRMYQEGSWCTYVAPFDKYTRVIRYPGASRGKIVVDNNNMIQELCIYDDQINSTYDSKVNEALKQFIGSRLID